MARTGGFQCGYIVDLASGIASESSVHQFSNFGDFHGNLSNAVTSDMWRVTSKTTIRRRPKELHEAYIA